MKMRIGIDATALPARPVGAGYYILHLVRALSQTDYGFELIVFAHRQGLKLLGLVKSNHTKIIEIPDYKPAQRLLWEQALFPAYIRRSGVDLLHSLHYTKPIFLSTRSVVTFHDMTFFLYPGLHTLSKRLFFPAAIRASARQADALIAVSESTRRDTIRLLNVIPQKITTTVLGVEPIFHPIIDKRLLQDIRDKHQLPQRFLLYVGLVEPRKNLPLLIRAFKRLLDGGLDHSLVIVGRLGWKYEEVFRLIEECNLKNKVTFTGYVDRQELPFIYNSAEVFVYPTLYEGFGLPVLEAMACGTPVVTTDIASLPEIVGEAGLLAPVSDVIALEQKIMNILENPELKQRLSIAGCERAAGFTWERTARETAQVYKKTLGEG
jgi:glycosyltransferase involved in cell wall biosynthesis